MERNKSLTEAELLIKKSEDRYKNLINSIKDGIVIIKNGKITFTNDFIISPYYLMNGGYFSNHNSLVLMLYGNETVFYHYLN